MKNIIKGFILAFSVALSTDSFAQQINSADSTGLAGDNFSLQGAMELFKKAKSPEAFETALNNEKNSVNNLDLNDDGQTDYIKVKDIGEKNSRVFVLQVDVNAKETQDVAVITIEKTDEKTATIQIKGAEELYGEDKLYEPLEEKTKGGKGGPDAVMETYFVYVNVWFWPCVQYVYAPTYVYWYSPWYWNYYPTWWSPWYVSPWRTYYRACYHYQPYCHQVYEYRNYDAYALYGPRKSTATAVHNRYERSNYKSTQDNRTNKQQVVGRERVNQYEGKSGSRTESGGKMVEPTREKNVGAGKTAPARDNNVTREKERANTNNNSGKELNGGRNSSSPSKPSEVNKGRDSKQERVNTPQSRPSSNSGSKERVSAPSKSQQPSKAPSVGRTSPQPSKGGQVSPQRSAPSPQRSAPAPSKGSGGGNSGRRK